MGYSRDVTLADKPAWELSHMDRTRRMVEREAVINKGFRLAVKGTVHSL